MASLLIDTPPLSDEQRDFARTIKENVRGGAPPACKPSPLRILLAEDSAVNQKIMVRLLQRYGHSVAVAGNGIEVMAALQQERFDAILMDVQMPEVGGIEATGMIRRLEQGTGRHVPIIALTGYATDGDKERFLTAGMDDYVTKPVNAGLLLETIARVTRARPEEDDLHRASMAS